MLTVGALQLGHGGHEGALGHVALDRGHERLLVGGVQWLGELDRLQRGQAATHAVDDGHALCLSGGQTCAGQAGVSQASHPPPMSSLDPVGTLGGTLSLLLRACGLEEGGEGLRNSSKLGLPQMP